MNGCRATSMFAMKAIMKQRPYTIIFSSLIVTVSILGYCIRLFESDPVLNELSGHNYDNFYNCIWNVIITLVSVGYGDLFPKTFFGRIVAVLVCFWGIFFVSFFVVTVSNLITFSSSEEKSFELLNVLFCKMQLKQNAIKVVESAYTHRNAIKANKDKDIILSHYQTFRSKMLSFQRIAKHVKSFNEKTQEVDII